MDSEAKKILQGLWADNGDRVDPEDPNSLPVLDREEGYPASFSQDPGHVPTRGRFNQRWRELDGAARDSMRFGGVLPYDAEVDYLQWAHCTLGRDEFVALVANGPSTGNVTSPATPNQAVWSRVQGEVNRPEAPDAPAGVAGNGQIRWDTRCPSDGGDQIDHFDVQWRQEGGSWSAAIEVRTPHYLLTGLVNGRRYEARFRATNSRGDSPWGGVGRATPVASAPSGGGLLALRADPGDAQVGLTWLAPPDNGAPILDYTVQWRSGSQAFSAGRQVVVNGTMRTITGLANGTEYFFQVRARNAQGAGPWSNTDSATPAAPPVIPTPDPDTAPGRILVAPRATLFERDACWAWQTPADGGQRITSYDFQHRRQGAAWAGGVVQVAEGGYVQRGLPGGTTEARVRGVNSVGTAPEWSPTGSVVLPVGMLYAVDTSDSPDDLWLIDPVTPSNSTRVGALSSGLTGSHSMASHNGMLYIVEDNGSTSELWLVNVGSPGTSVSLGALPSGILDPRGLASHNGRLYCAVGGTRRALWLINTSNPSASTEVGSLPTATSVGALASYSDTLYMTNLLATDELWRVDTVTPNSSARVGAFPSGLTAPNGMSPGSDGNLYCLNSSPDELWRVDTVTPSNSIRVGALPSGLVSPIALALHDA